MSNRPTVIRHTARLKPLAELVDRCIEPALAAQGFAASGVIMAWPEIVGERLARHTEPMRIVWPKRNAGQAQASTLVVRVTSAFALELQHMAPVVIERVNTHFGWRCVGQLALRQGPIPRRVACPEPERRLDPAQEQRVADAVRDITDDPLGGGGGGGGCGGGGGG
ncbi:DUF721 domain-containing protein, partial [Pseudochelatococcus sp. B33]